MTDKTLLQESRDALAKILGTRDLGYYSLNEGWHTRQCRSVSDHREAYKCDCFMGDAKETITRLDVELAKVAEPVVLDLSGVPKYDGVVPLSGILAAVRAQLPGIEVKV